MHRLFSMNRVFGEWFEFTQEGELQAAISTARALALEATSLVPFLAQAESFKQVESNGKARIATSEEYELAFRHSVARSQIALCRELESTIRKTLMVYVSAGGDVSQVARKTSTTTSGGFLEGAFKLAHPEMWRFCLADNRRWYHRFSNRVQAADNSSLGPVFLRAYSLASQQVSAVRTLEDVIKLNEPTLALNRLTRYRTMGTRHRSRKTKSCHGRL